MSIIHVKRNFSSRENNRISNEWLARKNCNKKVKLFRKTNKKGKVFRKYLESFYLYYVNSAIF